MTILEILSKSPQERHEVYKAVDMDKVTIDNEVYTGYGTFSFAWEKSYVKSPVRSGDGSINNLDSYATFIVPHFTIHFDIMSIDDYRRLMKQVLAKKNEFDVTCYDIVYNKLTTNKMYFPPNELPKLYTICNSLQSGADLLGVLDFTVEMIGTKSFAVNNPTE